MDASNYLRTPLNGPFIPQRADPYLLRHTDGQFYFTASLPAYDAIAIRRADSLSGLREAEERVVWRAHSHGEMSMHIWAPELHFLDGAWYLYFAAGKKENIWAIRPWVLRCAGPDPLSDPWEEMGMVRRADAFCFNDFSLDMTVFSHRGRRYAVWAQKVNRGKKISNLYIAEMASPTALSTPQVLLSSPCYDWEREGFWVNEGPAFLDAGERVCLTFSASATGACYCMGMLWADAGADLLDPWAWKKSRQPVLRTDAEAGLFGPGHNSFCRLEDGSVLMAYHARPYDEITGDPLYDPNRHCYLMRVDWREGLPVFDFRRNLTEW